ncbi:hypothetical protein [Rhodococcus sp. SGAir0479]|uniref:hypothetical protein n=1 Tax=Rhodococcus sp. SGAir0479 TaxID=2567884 RepID=UPI0010CCC280|nr:hypothetical protein [Rhodococcus sp. SGAir0479]QCQ90216.1 hypothetical protein E7742_02615 [Rhodococcus sp. SGAir0479]
MSPRPRPGELVRRVPIVLLATTTSVCMIAAFSAAAEGRRALALAAGIGVLLALVVGALQVASRGRAAEHEQTTEREFEHG